MSTRNGCKRPDPGVEALTGTEYLTFGELAADLRVSERTVHRMVTAGDLPQPERFGRTARFNRQAVVQRLESRRRQAERRTAK